MRISDWSSDVCSSDLLDRGAGEVALPRRGALADEARGMRGRGQQTGDGKRTGARHDIASAKDHRGNSLIVWEQRSRSAGCGVPIMSLSLHGRRLHPGAAVDATTVSSGGHRRSEEHTSELQSLMRISYAVF